MSLPGLTGTAHFWLARFLAGRRAWVLGAGAFFFPASMLARRASIRLTTCGAGPSFAGSIFSPASLLFEQIDQRVLIAVLELRRIEVAGFGLDDVSGEIEHLFRGFHIGNVLEIGLLIANLVGIAQGKSHQTAAACLEVDDVFSARQDNTTESNQLHFGYRIADDRKGILSHLAVGSDVVGGVDVSVIDLASWNELINFNRTGAFDLHGIDLLIFDKEVLAFATSNPRAVSSRSTTSPVSESTFCCFNRLPVFRLIRLKLTFSLSVDAG
jgi:hypothetical protein